MAGIYAIHCKKNNKMYIGQTKGTFNSRFNCHRCDLNKNRGIQKLQEDWNCFGEDAFELIILEDNIQDTQLRNEREKFYIEYYDSIENGYNTAPGGIGQGNFKYLNGMYGKHHTDKSKELMSKHRKGLNCGSDNYMYGRHLTPEQKKLISDANKGRIQSEEEKESRRQSMKKWLENPDNQLIRKQIGLKNRKYSDEWIAQIREDYILYGSIKEVSLKHNISYEICRQIIRHYGNYSQR